MALQRTRRYGISYTSIKLNDYVVFLERRDDSTIRHCIYQSKTITSKHSPKLYPLLFTSQRIHHSRIYLYTLDSLSNAQTHTRASCTIKHVDLAGHARDERLESTVRSPRLQRKYTCSRISYTEGREGYYYTEADAAEANFCERERERERERGARRACKVP